MLYRNTVSNRGLYMFNDVIERKYQNISYVIISIISSLFLIFAVLMPVFLSQFIYPGFLEIYVNNTNNHAVLTGKSMARAVLESYSDGQIVISNEIKTQFKEQSEDYELLKVKVFDDTGLVLYSTEFEDIGEVNIKDYFQNLQITGVPFSQLISKNTENMEGQVISRDVVETYVPIFHHGHFIGAFELYHDITDSITSLEKLIYKSNLIIRSLALILVCVVIVAMIGLRKGAMKQKKYENLLLELAHNDRLTGILNRGRFYELLKWEIDRYLRHGRNSSLILVDVDHFKRVNDIYGHLAGDVVLTSIVDACIKTLRGTDIMGRYGGEEFIIVLPEIPHDKALEVAERLRSTIEKTIVFIEDQAINMTISLGLVHFDDFKDLTIESIIKQADLNMYTAKNNGRNQVFSK